MSIDIWEKSVARDSYTPLISAVDVTEILHPLQQPPATKVRANRINPFKWVEMLFQSAEADFLN
jgi:hypothetical protein